ncbi:MAG: DedA family protein [Pseudomonadota bacterium]
MHHDLFSDLAPLVIQYGYWVLFPVAVVEGPATSVLAGTLVGWGQFDGAVVFFLLVAADLLGDALYYSLGRWGHTPFLERLERRLSLTPERFRPLEEGFRKHDWKLLLIGKTQPFGSIILYFAGATKMPIWRYLLFNLVATGPKVLLFETVGYFIGAGILHSTKVLDYITFLFFGIGLVLLAAYWLIRKYLRKEISNADSI